MKIGILTSQQLRQLHADDNNLIDAFKNRNIDVKPVVWDSNPNWESFDAIVIRTPWDYARRWNEFQQVIEKVSEKTLMIHSLELVKWNADKTYLQKIGNDLIKKSNNSFYKF